MWTIYRIALLCYLLPMRYYPVFLNLQGKECLVVGAGQVGRRKIAAVLDSGIEKVTVVDINEPDEDFRPLLDHPALVFEHREFAESDLDGKFMVIACTDNEDLNWRISRLCSERSIMCNIVDQPEKCSFIVPAMFTQGELTMAVSTGGYSPALAKKIRRDLDEYFGKEYGHFLDAMGKLRPHVLALGKSTKENTALFRSIVDSGIIEALKEGDRDKAVRLMADRVPEKLKKIIPELF